MGKNKLLIALGALIILGIGLGLLYTRLTPSGPDAQTPPSTSTGTTNTPFTSVGAPSGTPSPSASPAAGQPSPGVQPSGTAAAAVGPKASNPNPDLTTDANGLSRATIVVTTNQGIVRLKLYPKDAPNTVKRILELINRGFYNGLSFHRVVPGFVIQGGDPQGNGTGGSGQKLKAEFNERRHVEGAVAMARAADPDSADSQFYITLGPQPHLDHNYTVFGQVIEGMEVVRKIQVGDKMTSVIVE